MGFGGKILGTIREADVEMGHKVVVVGQGLKGQLTNLIAYYCGADVLGVDNDENRLKIAESGGVKTVNIYDKKFHSKIRDTVTVTGADIVFVTCMIDSGKIWDHIWDIIRPQGRLVIMQPQDIHLNYSMVSQKNLIIMNHTNHKKWEDYFSDSKISIPAAYAKHSIQSDMEGFKKMFFDSNISLKHLNTLKLNVDINQKELAISLRQAQNKLGILCSFIK
jgi:threonine dehydrogenase-like Zn-dependent dehydrogenase